MPIHTYTNWNIRPSDADIFEEKVSGYEELIKEGEKSNIIGITNPGFEVFLLLHIEGAYEKYIKDNNDKFFELDVKKRYRHPYNVLLEVTGMNSKKNSKIGHLAFRALYYNRFYFCCAASCFLMRQLVTFSKMQILTPPLTFSHKQCILNTV